MLSIYIPHHQHEIQTGYTKVMLKKATNAKDGHGPYDTQHVFMPKIAKFTRCGTDTGNQYFKVIILI